MLFQKRLICLKIPSSVVEIVGNPFHSCLNLESIEVDGDNQFSYATDGVLFNRDESNLVCYSEKRSGEYNIPDSVKSIGIKLTASAIHAFPPEYLKQSSP